MFWSKVTKITAQEAKKLMDREDTLFIDVRRPKHYKRSHIEGALLGDRHTVHNEIDPSKQSTPIICYCYSGFSSKTACRNLTKAGFNRVLNLKGGYPAWKRAFQSKKD
ncbi:MAG: rhodanese-like domain-containing protein [Opitutaceae bacterium]|nr:rhodanese-like domain-containing protein [Opitutaceae bacterium]